MCEPEVGLSVLGPAMLPECLLDRVALMSTRGGCFRTLIWNFSQKFHCSCWRRKTDTFMSWIGRDKLATKSRVNCMIVYDVYIHRPSAKSRVSSKLTWKVDLFQSDAKP